MYSSIESLDLLFFNDLDLNHPNSFLPSSLSLLLPLHKSWLIFFRYLSLSLFLSLLIVSFRSSLLSYSEEKPQSTHTIIQKLQLTLCDLTIQNSFRFFCSREKIRFPPLSTTATMMSTRQQPQQHCRTHRIIF